MHMPVSKIETEQSYFQSLPQSPLFAHTSVNSVFQGTGLSMSIHPNLKHLGAHQSLIKKNNKKKKKTIKTATVFRTNMWSQLPLWSVFLVFPLFNL